ncbi:hypothetical protein Naga_101125g1, partial [Nannochloropsis gaditana]
WGKGEKGVLYLFLCPCDHLCLAYPPLGRPVNPPAPVPISSRRLIRNISLLLCLCVNALRCSPLFILFLPSLPPPSFPSFPPPPLSFSLGHAPPSFPCSQQCRQALDSLVARFYSDAVEARETPEVKYCASMLQYLDARLERAGDAAQRREEEKLARVAAGEEGGGLREGGDWKGSVGHLLGLMCGHNASFSEEERARLMYHLSRGWTVESFAGP